MFNLLVSGSSSTWDSDQRMGMMAQRFLEYSGDERAGISITQPDGLKVLERVQTLLMYEDCVECPDAEIVRVGQMRDIRIQGGEMTFRFTETGRLPRTKVLEFGSRLQFGEWEKNRTHWAVKDGEIPQDLLALMVTTPKKYDIVLSFAGDDRKYVEAVADYLDQRNVIVFYDGFEEATLWGKDLAEHFESVYRKQARYCVMFISAHYADKVWTKHERRAALARAMVEKGEYVLPVRFDDTEIPGLRPTVGYFDLREKVHGYPEEIRLKPPERLGQLILQKLGRTF